MSKLVLFDFDGVIADTFEMAYEFHERLGIDISRDEYKDMFMGNIYDAVKDGKSKEEFKEMHDKWFDLYSPEVLEQPVHEGMDEAIKNLAQDYTLMVISSSLSSPVSEYLKKYDLNKYFVEIYGSDIHHSKVEKVNMVFDKYNATSQECVFVTDTVGDMMEMNKLNIDSIVVTWGFHNREHFKDLLPYAFVDTSKELVSEVDKYFKD